jgi:hypothetical protein
VSYRHRATALKTGKQTWRPTRPMQRACARFFAAGVQASGYTLQRNFNHNDLYHVIQTAAMLLFYIGARRLRDSSKHQGKE